jgi:uncharacterized protein (TIGR03435 family)
MENDEAMISRVLEARNQKLGGRLPPPPPSDNPPPSLFEAIQEQLGMKLDAVKAPADVMVIENAEKPSAN